MESLTYPFTVVASELKAIPVIKKKMHGARQASNTLFIETSFQQRLSSTYSPTSEE